MADVFSFGSIIGSITNKGSNGFSLLPLIEEKYGINSEPYNILKSRLQQCCKAQSCQIDKAKLGREVKGIPDVWISKQDDEILNDIILNKYPYFFKYLYKQANSDYNNYKQKIEKVCRRKFNMSLETILLSSHESEECKIFVESFYKYSPLIHSNSEMNLLCYHIEKFNFDLKSQLKPLEFDYHIYYDNSVIWTQQEYDKVKKFTLDYVKNVQNSIEQSESQGYFNEYLEKQSLKYKRLLFNVNKDINVILRHLIILFYEDRKSLNKDLLWQIFGNDIFRHIKKNHSNFSFPIKEEDGDLTYLGKKYSWKELEINEEI